MLPFSEGHRLDIGEYQWGTCGTELLRHRPAHTGGGGLRLLVSSAGTQAAYAVGDHPTQGERRSGNYKEVKSENGSNYSEIGIL
jgi:hypothetical protein